MASPGGVEVGRVSVRVLPDTSRLGTDLRIALDRIEAQTDLTISTSIDTTLLDSQARAAVEQAQLAAGDLDIKTNVDTSQVREAESVLGRASSAAQGFSSSLGGIATAAILLGPALIPLGAALAGLVATLVAPLAIVGGGLTLFGVITGFTISETQKQLKVINQLDTKLSGLTKGTQEYADTLAQLRNAQAALTPAQKAFAASLDHIKSVFNSIPKAIVLKPVTDGLNLLARVIPLVTPILKVVSGVIDDLIGKFDVFARSQGFKDFVSAFAKQLGPDLKAFATIAGNIFQGLFGLFGAFNKQLSGSVLKSLENLTGQFADWGRTIGSSKGFRSFVTYLRQTGPKVTAALGAIAGAAVAIVTAFAPVGGVVLQAITDMANAIAKIPAGVLESIAVALVTLVAASKLLGPLAGLISAIIAAPEVAIVVGLIAALAGVFILLYNNSKPLRRVLGDLGDFFRTNLLPLIQDAAKKIMPALNSAIRDISRTIRDNRGFLEVLGKLILALASAAVIGSIIALVLAIRGIGKAIQFGITVAHLFADAFLAELIFITNGVGFFVQAVLDAFGKVVDAAASAFGFLPKIGGQVKAAQANFHEFQGSVNDNIASVSAQLKDLKTQIDAVGNSNPTFKVTAQTLEAVRQLEALQAFRIRDKAFSVKMELELERTVGPGGGIGHPLGTSDGGGASRSVSPPDVRGGSSGGGTGPRAGRDAPLVQVDNLSLSNLDDLLRKSQDLLRGQAGGGVILMGAGT